MKSFYCDVCDGGNESLDGGHRSRDVIGELLYHYICTRTNLSRVFRHLGELKLSVEQKLN